jgi:hypothetical protein
MSGVIELLKSSQILITRLQEPLFMLILRRVLFPDQLPHRPFGGYLEKRWSND